MLQNEIYTGAVVSLKSTMDSRKGKPAAGKRKMRYACGGCGKRLTRRNGTDLYFNRGYMVKDCECRQPGAGWRA